MNRYHRDLGFPKNVSILFDRYFDSFISVRYSNHAKRETVSDRYGIIPVIKRSSLQKEDCFEIVVQGNQIIKAVFRISGGPTDYCYSVSCEGVVVTCWANNTDDTHQTLDTRAYSRV